MPEDAKTTINGADLIDVGWPEGPLIGEALEAAAVLSAEGLDHDAVLTRLEAVREDPVACTADATCRDLARAWLQHRRPEPADRVRDEPMEAPIWGEHLIDRQAIEQLHDAMRLPVAVAGALMPDAHVGYGLPIGGVVALEGAVAPYMVGVDIACRMMMSVFPADDAVLLAGQRDRLKTALREETRFGLGASFGKHDRRDHAVMDDPDWNETAQLRRLKDKARAQLGTSGTGNHFVDAGLLEVGEEGADALGVEPGTYFALLSHSGSRGFGATIASHYSKVAREETKLPKALQALAWLPMSSPKGQEYWLSMQLAGRYASANHHVIHRSLAKRLGLDPLAQVENHHNYCWRETHVIDGEERDVYVHRKGATPAGEGILGIIPGSQGHDSFVVRGKGNARSLDSAGHGAGRTMSRTQAKKTIPKAARNQWLRERDVELMAGGMDEAPQAYKDIEEVLALQRDLVEPVARFKPRLVLMASDGKSEG